jgi:ENTS family enterobactin (siderophore) exporter
MAAAAIWGVAITVFGLVSSLPVALVLLAVAGMGDMISMVLRNTLLQLYTPDALRGRVSSLYLAQVTSTPALGNVEAGAVARALGLEFSIVSGGLACVAGALVLGGLIPALRTASLRDTELVSGLSSPGQESAAVPDATAS